MDVAVREAHDIALGEGSGRGASKQQYAATAQRDPDLLRSGVGMRRVLGTWCNGDPRKRDAPRLGILREEQLLGRQAAFGKRRDLGSPNDLHG